MKHVIVWENEKPYYAHVNTIANLHFRIQGLVWQSSYRGSLDDIKSQIIILKALRCRVRSSYGFFALTFLGIGAHNSVTRGDATACLAARVTL